MSELVEIFVFIVQMPWEYSSMFLLWDGGIDIIQHYTLRLLLMILGKIPGNYACFLDSAVERIFIQQVGGGDRFMCRLLLEYFGGIWQVKD